MHNGAQFLFAFLVGDPTSRDRNRPLSSKLLGTSTSTSLWGRWAPTGLIPRPSPPTHMLGYYGRAPVAPGRARELCPPPRLLLALLEAEVCSLHAAWVSWRTAALMRVRVVVVQRAARDGEENEVDSFPLRLQLKSKGPFIPPLDQVQTYSHPHETPTHWPDWERCLHFMAK
jgi:hypothetical protein